MADPGLDRELIETAEYIAHLSRRAQPHPSHHARLRQELQRRHQELVAESSQRTARMLRPRLTGLKRLTLVAPPALAMAAALVLALFGLPGVGRPAPQAAVAARITDALVRSVPTVTSWQVNVQQQRGNSAISTQCSLQLKPYQRLYVRGARSYLYSYGKWYQVTSVWQRSGCPEDLQFDFAILPAHLAHHSFSVLPGRVVQGTRTEGIRYTMTRNQDAITSTLWVDRKSGLVLQAQRVIRSGKAVVERDLADYTYTRAR